MIAQQSKGAALPRPHATDDSTAELKAKEALCHSSLPQITAQNSKEAAIPKPHATDDSKAESKATEAFSNGYLPQMIAQQSRGAAITTVSSHRSQHSREQSYKGSLP